MTDYKSKLDELIKIVEREGASDLHLTAGEPPAIRVAGNLTPLVKQSELSGEDTYGLLQQLLSEGNLERFEKHKELDFSYEHSSGLRFRGNAFYQRQKIGVALRAIPEHIRTVSELNLPQVLESFARRKQGFFLTVGPVGQGKSTTLAALINLINQERAEHIVTIEDPVEYLFENEQSIIDQREVTIDTYEFNAALTAAFRQDVDVMMIGEMRDAETMATAVTAAETGHLVFSTLHTNDAPQTIDRIIDSFPANQQSQIRAQLAGSLVGIFSQRLVPRVSGGVIPAYELLINNNAVASLIREGRTHELDVVIETGSQQGMVTMNQSLAELVRKGEISQDSAYLYSQNPKALEKLI